MRSFFGRGQAPWWSLAERTEGPRAEGEALLEVAGTHDAPVRKKPHRGTGMEAIECVCRGWRDYVMTFRTRRCVLVDPLRR